MCDEVSSWKPYPKLTLSGISLELREFTAAFTRTKVVVCRPSANCSEQYQLFLRLPEATNVHHYIKHATFITYGTQPSNRTYCMSNAHRLKV